MRRAGLSISLAVMACLSGCSKPEQSSGTTEHSRYLGVGVFSVGSMWPKMVQAAQPANPATAKLTDDEHVIVVVDSHTGEIRECGDLTGYCVRMNPWTRAIAPNQSAPVSVTEHAKPAPAAK